MTTSERDVHLFGSGPKRILALDGGGIRGILTLQILYRIEQIVRQRSGNPEATLSDYFDLIGGTSTGAIIAAGLSLGWQVEKLDNMYRELGHAVFQSEWFRLGLLRAKFDDRELRKQLSNNFGETTLGSEKLRTGFAAVMKRLDTGSPWVVYNNPRGKYFHPGPGSKAIANGKLRLQDVVRASTAAPTYFKPEAIAVAEGQVGAFVDGGVSPHNNPALQLLMLATMQGHGLQWSLDESVLLLVSVGTGNAIQPSHNAERLVKAKAAKLGIQALASLMDDASALNETILQWLSRSATARQIDRDVGDLSADVLGGHAWLTYLRYQVWLDKTWLKNTLDIELSLRQLESLAKMDEPDNMDSLVELGRAAGERLVEDRHFPSAFDLA